MPEIATVSFYTHYFYLVVFLINLAFVFLSQQVFNTALNKRYVGYFIGFFVINIVSWVNLWLIETSLLPFTLHINAVIYILTHWCVFMALNALSHHPRLIKWVSVFSAAGIAFVFMINRQISFYDFVSLYSLPIDIAALYVIKSIDRDVNHKERDIGLILITLAIVLEFLSALVELFGGWWIAEQILEYRLPILSGTVGFFLVGLGFITSILTQDKLRIISQSQTDPLTNVLNRRGLEAHVQSLLFKRQDISLLLLDIDYFKNINDRYGHDFGDFVLKAFSELISQNIRQDDLFSRIGGEEFVLILPQTKPEFAIRVAEDLRQKIEQSEFEFQQQTLGITCSFGIAFCTQHFDFNLMVKQADMALYHAKNNGRNKVEVYQE